MTQCFEPPFGGSFFCACGLVVRGGWASRCVRVQAARSSERGEMPSRAGASRIRAARATGWSGALGSSQTWRGLGVRFGGRALAIGRGGASAARRAASAILSCVVDLGARALAIGEASGRPGAGAARAWALARDRFAIALAAMCRGRRSARDAGTKPRASPWKPTSTRPSAPGQATRGPVNSGGECRMLVGGPLRCVANQRFG